MRKQAGGTGRDFRPCSAASMLGDLPKVPLPLFHWLLKDDIEFGDLCVSLGLSIPVDELPDKDLSCSNIMRHPACRSQLSASYLALRPLPHTPLQPVAEAERAETKIKKHNAKRQSR